MFIIQGLKGDVGLAGLKGYRGSQVRTVVERFFDLFRDKVKALSHGAIFLATCNAILLLGDVQLANTCFHHSLPIYSSYQTFVTNLHLLSLKSRTALQVARKITPCDRALNVRNFNGCYSIVGIAR